MVIWLLIVQTEIISSSIGGMVSKTEWLWIFFSFQLNFGSIHPQLETTEWIS